MLTEPLTLKNFSQESRIVVSRILIGSCILLLLTGLLVSRFVYLQIIAYDTYSTLADENRIRVQPIPPVRGIIHDRNGVLLADNIPSFNLMVTKEWVTDLDTLYRQLGSIIKLTDEDIADFELRLNRRQRPYESVPIRFRLTQEEIARISVDLYSMLGVDIEAQLIRHYPYGNLVAHAVGSVRRINEDDMNRIDRVAYSGLDHIGKLGVEVIYEEELRGKVGYQHVETNAHGRIMKTLDSRLPEPGTDITLHLDIDLQMAASQALGERRGAVVAIDPKTGGILALVSTPGYDPNLFVTGITRKDYADLLGSKDKPLFNRAVQGQYEPGSTVKPILGLAGLALGHINASTQIDDPGWFKLPHSKRLYRDWNWQASGQGGHGHVNITRALYRSCNVYFYQLAVDLGIDHVEDYLGMFGFGATTALDVWGAKQGLLPNPEWKSSTRGEIWYPGDTVNISIGQGDMLATPLQLATAVAVLANRGRWLQPRILKSGSRLHRQVDARIMPDIDRVPNHVWDTIIDGMVQVVNRGNQGYGENGTAWAHIGQKIPYIMAGKSGTSQLVEIQQGKTYEELELDDHLQKHAWFVAFAPVEDPQIAIAAIVENGGGGSEIAGPVVRAVADEYLLRDELNLASPGPAAQASSAIRGEGSL